MVKWLTKLYASDRQFTQREQLLLANSTAMYNSTSIDISQRTTTTCSQAQLAQEYDFKQLWAQMVIYAGGNAAVLMGNNCLLQQLYAVG